MPSLKTQQNKTRTKIVKFIDSTGTHLILLTVLVLALFARSIGTAFVGDSASQFRWMEAQSFFSLFLTPAWIYRPLPFVIWKLLRSHLGYYDTALFHAVNLFFHAFNGALVFLLARRVSSNRGLAFTTALLFISHPYNYQTAWVEVLFHPLLTFFTLLTFVGYMQVNSLRKANPWIIAGSCLTLFLAFLSHEGGLIILPLLVAYDLIYKPPHKRGYKTRCLRLIPYALTTALYLVWWWSLPKSDLYSPHLRLGFELLEGLPFFLQGFAFPVAPLTNALAAWLPVDPSLAFIPMALTILGVVYLIVRRNMASRIFYLSIAWAAISILPALLLLSGDYISSGPRLFYLGSIGSALLWAGALSSLSALFHRSRARLFLTIASLGLILGPAAIFVQARLDLLEKGSLFVYDIVHTAEDAKTDDNLVYLNLPNFLPDKTDYPLGSFGMVVLHDYMPLEDMIYVHGGGVRRVWAYVSPELVKKVLEEYPYEESLFWSYYTYGQPLGVAEWAIISTLVDQVYVFDPSTWRLLPIRNYDIDWQPLLIVKYLREQLEQGQSLYLISGKSDLVQEFRLRRGINLFDGSKVLVLPSNSPVDSLYLIERTDSGEDILNTLRELFPKGSVERQASTNNTYITVFRVPAGEEPGIASDRIVRATLDQGIELMAFDLQKDIFQPGEVIFLTLYWRATGPVETDYTVFTHLLGSLNPLTGTPLWGQHDSQPGGGSYPTTIWQEGEIVIDSYQIPIQENAPAGEYWLEVGMYLLETGQRLPIVGSQGEVLQDSLVLTTIRVGD